jgi:hypothetical protein
MEYDNQQYIETLQCVIEEKQCDDCKGSCGVSKRGMCITVTLENLKHKLEEES